MPDSIRVVIADDSAFMRKVISQMLSADDEISVVGQARDGVEATEMAERLRPDVITLDIQMPRLDGVGALERIMRTTPTAVVMLSSLSQAGADITLKCLEIGAVDFVGKPSGAISLDIEKVCGELVAKVKSAARSKRFSSHASAARTHIPAERPSAPSVDRIQLRTKPRVILIGSSTGGPMALQKLVPAIPADIGLPIVIVQHMPPMFTASLARRLDDNSAVSVREASVGCELKPGLALVATGGFHLTFDPSGSVVLTDEPPLHGVRPAVDVTAASLVKNFGAGVLAVLLTGMGRDGARGLKTIHDLGGMTIAEDESTCVIYGMPRAAVELNGVGKLLPLDEIAAAIVAVVRGTARSMAA